MPPVASDAEHKSDNEVLTDASIDSVTSCSHKDTIIFLDWDDTLLCSSFLSSEGFRLDSDMTDADHDLMSQLKELETCVINVIKLAVTFGDVHVVTNAETGWVQLSAQKFLPGVVPMLSKVKVLSARSTYENMFPDSPLKWKYYAFQERLSHLFSNTERPKNILSFGDSHVEREAVRAVTRGFPNTRTKSIKFAERPSIEQLQRQIELVTNCFQYIYNHEGDLDLCMSLSVTPNQEDTQDAQTQPMQQIQSNGVETPV